MKRLAVVLLMVVLAVAVLCLGSTESLTNHNGKTASGVIVTFSESVHITSYDQRIFPNQNPAGRAETFTFRGGELPNGGHFKVTWTPSSAEILNSEWIAATYPASGTPDSILDFGVPAGSIYHETFDGDSVDPCTWEVQTWNEGQATQTGSLVLKVVKDVPYSMVKAVTQWRLDGDFDVQVSYALGNGWSADIRGKGSYPRIDCSLGIYIDDSTFVDFSRIRSGASGAFNVYSSLSSSGLLSSSPASTTAGTLRVLRRGARLTFYAREAGSWTTLCEAVFVADPVRLYLGCMSLDGANAAEVRFDDLAITGGAILRRPLVWTDSYSYDPEFYVGGWISDYLANREWNRFWHSSSPLQIMSTNGFEWARVWVTMTESTYLRDTPWSSWPSLPWRNEYWSSVEYAERILTEAASLGLRLNAVLTLSDTAAHAGQQIPPAGWEALSVEETSARLTEYGAAIAGRFKQAGLKIELYDVGNEIDKGILGLRPGERVTLPAGVDQTHNMGYMKSAIWPNEAKLLQATIIGIRRADPDAKIVLHVDGLDVNMDLAGSFFEFMVSEAVDFDYAGLSLPYPDSTWTLHNYSRDCWYQKLQDLVDRIGLLGKQVIICEGVYPSSTRGIGGQPMPDYPFTPEGQATWAHDLLRFARNSGNIKGFFYFDPDYFPGMSQDPSTWNVQSYGLFASDGVPKPAMQEFQVNLPPR